MQGYGKKVSFFNPETKDYWIISPVSTNAAALRVQTSNAVRCLRGLCWYVMVGDVAITGFCVLWLTTKSLENTGGGQLWPYNGLRFSVVLATGR